MTIRWIPVVLVIAAGLAAAETPSPALLVLNKDGNVAIIEPSSGIIVGRVSTGEGPHELAASTDGRLAFASNYGSQTPGTTLSVIDLIAQKEIHRVDVSPMVRPHGLFFAGGKLYFSAEVSKAIGRYDPKTNRVDWMLGTGQNTTHMVLLNKDLSKIFTANIGSDTITLAERVGENPLNWNETQIPVGKGPEGNDMSPDGTQIWAATSRDGGVSIIDIASKKVIETLSIGTKRSNRLKFTPDGKRVLISDLDTGELLVLDVATRKVIKRIPVGKGLAGILIPPDGSRAYAAATGDDKVGVVDLNTLELTGYLSTGGGPDGMAWAVRQGSN